MPPLVPHDRARWPHLLACCAQIAACGTIDPATVPIDTDAAPDTDLGIDAPEDPCTGTLELTLVGLPENQFAFPVTWEEANAVLTVGPLGSQRTRTGYDASSCLMLAPGTLHVDLLGTRCAAARATVEVIGEVVGGVTLRAFTTGEPRGTFATTTSGVREPVDVAPSKPFVELSVESLDAAVCRIVVERTALPEGLAPDDEVEPF